MNPEDPKTHHTTSCFHMLGLQAEKMEDCTFTADFYFKLPTLGY